MPAKQRVMTANGGANSALQATIASAEPKQTTFGALMKEGFVELSDASIAVIDLARGKIGFYASTAAGAIASALGAVSGTLATFTPNDPAEASTPHTLSGGGFVAAVAGYPPYWTEEHADTTNFPTPDVAGVTPVTGEDPYGFGALVAPQTPGKSSSQLVNDIESLLAEHAIDNGATTSGVIVVSEVDNTTKVKIVAAATTITGGTDMTTLSGVLATITGVPVASGGVARRYGG